MSALRSCYETEARFYNDDSKTNRIRWYWAAPDAPLFQGRHTFAPLSLSNGTDGKAGIVGEQMGSPRSWRDGSIPMAPPSGILDGTALNFYAGQSTSDPGVSRTIFGIPTGCAGEPIEQFCIGSHGQFKFFQLESPLGTRVGALTPTGDVWFIQNLDNEFAGVGDCILYASLPPTYNMRLVTNILSGVPANWYVVDQTHYNVVQRLSTLLFGPDGSDCWLRRL